LIKYFKGLVMSEKILCSCNTPLQLLNMINITANMYPNSVVDVCISDKITNAELLCKKLKESNRFNSVFFVKTNSFIKNGGLHNSFISRVTAIFLANKKIKKFIPDFSSDYTYFLFGNFDSFSNLITINLPKAKKGWVEDGWASYHAQGAFWIKRPNGIKAWAKHIFRINYIYEHTDIQYLYRPKLALFNIPFSRVKIPFLSENPDNIFSKIYGFSQDDEIKEKYIYFDAPFEKDGIPTNDKDLLEKISSIVGKENILVKIHPRNNSDYYTAHGYHINKNTYIPWEVFFMSSENIEDKVLISGWSTASTSPYFYFNNNKIKSVLLVNLIDKSTFSESSIRDIELIKNMVFIPANSFVIPETEEELLSFFKAISER